MLPALLRTTMCFAKSVGLRRVRVSSSTPIQIVQTVMTHRTARHAKLELLRWKVADHADTIRACSVRLTFDLLDASIYHDATPRPVFSEFAVLLGPLHTL